MKKHLILLLPTLLMAMPGIAQSLKSVSILGDSYSTFQGYITPETNVTWYFDPYKAFNTDVSSVTQTWWHRLCVKEGYRLCTNNSFSGATICNRGYRGEDYTDRSFITRMKNLGNPDIIFILGATNDDWAGVPIGEYKYEGWTKDDLFTFRPAMAYMLNWLKNRYPNVDIYFILNNDLKAEIDESTLTICKHYDVPCIELKDIDKKEGHPSIKGMEQICKQIKKVLKR